MGAYFDNDREVWVCEHESGGEYGCNVFYSESDMWKWANLTGHVVDSGSDEFGSDNGTTYYIYHAVKPADTESKSGEFTASDVANIMGLAYIVHGIAGRHVAVDIGYRPLTYTPKYDLDAIAEELNESLDMYAYKVVTDRLRKDGYECFHCMTGGVRWVGDFDSDDYGFEEPGVVHELECDNCGARITYFVPVPE